MSDNRFGSKIKDLAGRYDRPIVLVASSIITLIVVYLKIANIVNAVVDSSAAMRDARAKSLVQDQINSSTKDELQRFNAKLDDVGSKVDTVIGMLSRPSRYAKSSQETP